jgi:hypothetical protein
MAQMSQTMDKEINNLGYRVPGKQKVMELSYRSITFLSDYDNDGVIDTISYSMSKSRGGPITTRRIATPGERPLTWSSQGSMVLFSGFDSTGTLTTDPTRIRGIEASMLTSNVLYEKLNTLTSTVATSLTSFEDNSGQLTVSHEALLATAVDCQAGAYWHKVMYPKNLGTVAPQIAAIKTEDLGGASTIITNPGTSDPVDPIDPVDPVDPNDPVDPADPVDPGDTGGGTTITPPPADPCDPPPGNNDPCCCGSGLQYKKCCGA